MELFINLSGLVQGYQGIDYFRPKQLNINDTTYDIAWFDTVTIDGKHTIILQKS